jgi:hypothetical protein
MHIPIGNWIIHTLPFNDYPYTKRHTKTPVPGWTIDLKVDKEN